MAKNKKSAEKSPSKPDQRLKKFFNPEIADTEPNLNMNFNDEIKSVSSYLYKLSGHDFLNYICKLCANLLKTEFVYIAELNKAGTKVTVKAGNSNAVSVEKSEINIEHKPLKSILQKQFVCYPDNVQKKFPEDEELKKFNIEGFAGVPLLNNNDDVIGMLYLFNTKPITNIETIENYLRMFSGRIAAELNLIKKEEQLIKSEKKYQTLFETANDAINIIKGIEYVDCNSKTLELFGCKKKSELIGKTVLDFSPEKQPDGMLSKDKAWHVINETLKGIPQRFYWKHSKKDKTEIDTEVSLNPLQIEGATYFQAVVRDISQQKQSSELARKLSTAVEQSSASIVITNIEGEIEYVNPKFTEITGYTLDEVSGNKSNVLKSGYTSEEEYNELWNTILSGEVWKGEFKNVKKNGDYYWESASIAPITNKSGEITHFIAIKDDITDRKKVESLLKKSEEKYHSIFENLHDVLYITDLNGTILELSPSIGFHFGYDREKLLGTSVYDVYYDSNEREKFLNIIKREGIVSDYEIVLKNEFGDKVYCSANARLVFDENGNPIQVEGIMRNITERKLNEENLRLSEERFRQAQEVAHIGTFEHDVKNGFYWGSDEAKRILGFGLEMQNIPVLKIRECFVDPIKTSAILEDALKNRDSYNIEIEIYQFGTRKRKTINSIAEVKRDAEGNPIKVLGLIVDITERKKIEQELVTAKELAEENERRFKVLSSIAEEGLMIHEDGIILDVNHAFAKMAGYEDPEMLIGKNAFDVVPLTPESLKTVMENTRRNSKEKYDITLIKKDGSYVQAQTRGAEITYNERKARLVHMIDITDRKNAEIELLREKEKAIESDKLKTAFLLNISHEIRTPMNGILGFLNLLKEPDLSDVVKSDYIEIVNESGARLMDTINDIVEISKIETGDIELTIQEIDVSEIMQFHLNFFRLQAEKKGLTIKIKEQVEGDAAIIETDKHKLDGILMNLIKNAIKFTPKGEVEIGNYIWDDKLYFYVSDTGCGIPSDKIDDIFKRFVQADIGLKRNYEGSGIGLSIVKAHVESLNGEITVKSKVDKGSTFLFFIPYIPVKLNAEHRHIEKQAFLQSDNNTILVAEDDEVNYYLMEKMLAADYNLIHAVNGEDTIQLLKENPGISLILMDIKMPGKFDGLTATKIIRKFNKQIPIIAQTAYAQNSDKIAAINAGCNDYISKPFNASQLKSVILKYRK